MSFDTSTHLHFSPCPHLHITVEFTGSRRFVQGEVDDDIQEHILCLDCLEYLSETEALLSWDDIDS